MYRRQGVFLILVFFVVAFGHSQKVNEEKSAYYVGEGGKLYWRKSAPVYLFVSEKPDQVQHRMKSGSTTEYADPFYLDTEGINYIRTKEAVDPSTRKAIAGTEVLFEVYADSESPVSPLEYENVSKYQADGITYYKAGLEISVNSADALSGVSELYAGVNTEESPLYDESFVFNTGKAYTLSYYAEDNVGNIEDKHSISFTIDPQPPFSDLNINGITEENVVSKGSKLYLYYFPSRLASDLRN